jgi:SAM-dependent methyltransferase
MDTPDTSSTSGCCGPDSSSRGLPADPRPLVRERYGQVARGAPTAGCCNGPSEAGAAMLAIGYDAEAAAAVPEGANLGLGCGNPVSHADLRPGETVLDLGSGAGIDCFLAARAVGPEGRALGVDMTPEMVARARETAAKNDVTNVEFLLGEIEHLPVPDATVDAVLSNCVVNLSPDKPGVFREALRVLRPGGRMVVSDLVLLRAIDDALRDDVALYVGCVAGALLREEYLEAIRSAGFAEVEVLAEGRYTVGAAPDGPWQAAFEAVRSLTVRARKPV